MADPLLTKGQAVIEIMQATGYGRHTIEKKMDEFVIRGLITFEDDPGDTRKKLIRRSQVQILISALTKS
jgi:DNA-binding MarR family transcriptional regulator